MIGREREREKHNLSRHDSRLSNFVFVCLLVVVEFWWLSPHPRTRKGCDLRHETVSWKKREFTVWFVERWHPPLGRHFFSLFSREWCTPDSTTARRTLTTAGLLASSWKRDWGRRLARQLRRCRLLTLAKVLIIFARLWNRKSTDFNCNSKWIMSESHFTLFQAIYVLLWSIKCRLYAYEIQVAIETRLNWWKKCDSMQTNHKYP